MFHIAAKRGLENKKVTIPKSLFENRPYFFFRVIATHDRSRAAASLTQAAFEGDEAIVDFYVKLRFSSVL